MKVEEREFLQEIIDSRGYGRERAVGILKNVARRKIYQVQTENMRTRQRTTHSFANKADADRMISYLRRDPDLSLQTWTI